MKKAALLLRCSTNIQDFNRQKNDLLLVAKRFDFEVTESRIFGEYKTGKDDVRKGNRESVQKLIDACNDGEVEVALIWEVSRLSRNFIYGVNIVDKFNRDYHIPLYFRDKRKWTIDLDSRKIDLDFEKELRKAFEQAESELITLRIRFASGKRDTAGLGKAIGGPIPFGYKRPEGYNIINETTAPIVKELFKKYLEDGATLLSVVNYLKSKYPEYPRFKVVGSIRNLLIYKGYTGEVEYSIYDEVDDCIDTFYINQPAIIDEDMFIMVQEKLAKNRTVTPYPKAQNHLLQKLIKCVECGSFHTPSTSIKRGYTSYRCGTKTAHHKECNYSISLNEELLNNIIWNFIKEQLFSATEMNKEQREEAITKEKETKDNAQNDINLLNKSIERLNVKMNNLEDMRLEGDITKERFRIKKDELTSELNSITNQVERLNRKVQEAEFNIKRFQNTDFTKEYFVEIEADLDKKKKVVREYINIIYPHKHNKTTVVLEVETIEGVFYIFYNPRNNNRIAYYVNQAIATYQNGIHHFNHPLSGKSDNFYIPFPSLIMKCDEPEAFLTLNEMKEVCIQNNWEISY